MIFVALVNVIISVDTHMFANGHDTVNRNTILRPGEFRALRLNSNSVSRHRKKSGKSCCSLEITRPNCCLEISKGNSTCCEFLQLRC